MRLGLTPALLAMGLVAGSGASAQQAQFAPAQCDGRTAQDCNDLMGALDVPPERRAETLLARAAARLQAHDLAGAIAEYREITVVDRSSVLAYGSLGWLEVSSGQWDAAVSDLRRATTIAPGESDLYPLLIVALVKSGDCNSAAAELQETQAKFPGAERLSDADSLVRRDCR